MNQSELLFTPGTAFSEDMPPVRAYLEGSDLNAASVLRSRSLAQQLDLPEKLVAADLRWAQTEATARQIEKNELFAQWATEDEANAALAQEDVTALGSLFDHMERMTGLDILNQFGPGRSVLKGIRRFPGIAAESALQTAAMGASGLDIWANDLYGLGGPRIERLEFFSKTRDWFLEQARSVRSGYLETPSLSLPEPLQGKLWDNLHYLWNPTYLTFQFMETLDSFVIMLLGGAAAGGGKLAMAITGGLMEAGNLHNNLMEEKVSQERALTGALTFGVITGLLNKIGLDKMLDGPAGKGILQRLRHIAVAGATEGATEWAEEPFEALIAGIVRKDSAEKILKDVLESLKNIDVIPGSFLLGGSVRAAQGSRRQRAEEHARQQQELHQAVHQTQLARQSPESMQELLRKQGLQDVDVPANRLLELFQQDAALQEALGLNVEQLRQAAAMGHDITLPSSRLLARLNSEQFARLNPILREHHASPTLEEAEQARTVSKEEVSQLLETFQRQEEQQSAYEGQLERLRTEVSRAVTETPGLKSQAEARANGAQGYAETVVPLLRGFAERQYADMADRVAFLERVSVRNYQQAQQLMQQNRLFQDRLTEAERVIREKDAFSKQVDDFRAGAFPRGKSLLVGETPVVLQMLGAQPLPVHLPQRKLSKVMEGKHDLPAEIIKNLPELLANPVAIFDSLTMQNSFVVLTDVFDSQGRPVIVAVHLGIEEGRTVINEIASMYGRENAPGWLRQQVQNRTVRYINKGKATKAQRSGRLQLPREMHLGGRQKILNETHLVKMLEQRDGSTPRGALRIGPDGYSIVLGKQADLSTLVHESAHIFKEELQRLRDAGLADAAQTRDLATLDRWLGRFDDHMVMADYYQEHLARRKEFQDRRFENLSTAEQDAARDIAKHEYFARGFEAYLMEGKAPSQGLRSVFQRFKQWLLSIYKNSLRLGVEINDEIRGVFDRMLAVEQDIELAALQQELTALTARELDALNVSAKDRTYAAGLMDAAKARAQERLHADRERERNARVKEWRAEARQQLMAEEPVYALRSELRGKPDQDGTGPWLDVDLMRELYGDEAVRAVRKSAGPGAVRKNGADPELVAARHGYRNGSRMVSAIMEAQPLGRRVEEMVRAREAAHNAEHTEPGIYLAETHEAMEQVSLVGEYLSRNLGKQKVQQAAIQEAARARLEAMPMDEARQHNRFLAAMRRALRKERVAISKGDFAVALEANTQARLNMEFARQARDIHRDQTSTQQRMRRFTGMAKANPAARYAVMDMGMRHGLLKFNARLGEGKDVSTIQGWVREQQENGYPLFLDDALLYGPGKPWKEMSVAEFRELRDNVAQIIAVERNARQLLSAAGKQELDAAVQSITERIYQHRTPKTFKTVERDSGRLEQGLEYANAVHTKVETLCISLDGGTAMGPAWEHIYRPISQADDRQGRRLKEVKRELKSERLFGAYTRKELHEMHTKRTLTPEIGESLTREERISVALNMGNEGNLTRLREGHGWSDAQIQAVVRDLDGRDWRFVQNVWDYIGSYREEAFNLHEEITGLRPAAVEARPVHTPYGTFPGGYYPIRYNSDKSFRVFAQEQSQMDKELFGGRNYGAAMTKKGHLQERTQKGQGGPLLLEFSVITDHFYNVIHDLEFRKPVLDVAKVIKHPQLRTAIESTVGKAMYRELMPWLQDVAGERQQPMSYLSRSARWARASTSIMQMGWKFTTMFSQPFGFTQSIEVLGYKQAMRGLKKVYGNPLRLPDLIDATFEKSMFMAQRINSFDREVRDIAGRLNRHGRFAWVDAVRDSAFVPMGLFQMSVDLPTWWGAYEKGLKDHRGKEAQAIAYADSVVRMTQASGATKDLARVQRGSELAKLTTLFYSYFNTMYNLGALRVASLKRDRSPAAIFKAANTALLLWFIPAVLTELAAGRGPDEDEDPWEWAALEILKYPFMTVVGVRDVSNAVLDEYGYQITPAQSAPASVVKWFKTANKALQEDEEFDGKRFLKNSVEATGYLARLPLKQVIITVGNLWDYMSGDDPEFALRDLLFVKPKSRRN